MQLNVPQSVSESRTQISEIAQAIGAPSRGARLNSAIDAALERARPRDKTLIPALLWQGGGMVPGAGTLADELLRRTGVRTMSSAYGLQRSEERREGKGCDGRCGSWRTQYNK